MYMIRRAGTLHARCSSTIAGADQRSMVQESNRELHQEITETLGEREESLGELGCQWEEVERENGVL